MPQLEFAFLADAAEADPGRKFYVLGGGVDSIGARAFPVVHPHLSLVIRLSVHPTEADRAHVLEIKLMDSDGGELARVEGSFTASGSSAQPGREIGMNLVMNFQNTRFDNAGDYAFEVLINNQHMKSLPLRLTQVAAPPGERAGP